MNYHDGLKAYFSQEKRAPIVWLVLMILLIVIGLILTIYSFTAEEFLNLALVGFVLILIYAIWLLFQQGLYIPYKREYRQAKWQFGLTITFLLAIWIPYFYPYINYPNDDKLWKEWDSIKTYELSKAIDAASGARKLYREQSKAAESFLDHLPDYFFAPKDSVAALTAKEKAVEALSKHYSEIWQSVNIDFKNSIKRFNIDSIRYIVYRKQMANLTKYQDEWAPWLMIIQFKGLLIFSLLTLFLMAIWYHSYHLQLDGRNSEEFSEIAISKLSIYILFLLITPFFKPIEKSKISFGKPYITFQNPITVNNSVYVDVPKPPPPPQVNYIKIAHDVDSIVSKQMDSLVKNKLEPINRATTDINKEMGNVKKRATKKTKLQ